MLNACADRYRFAVGLAACLVAGKVSLLPSTHTPEVIRQLHGFAPDVVCLTDEAACAIALPQVALPGHAAARRRPARCRRSTATQLAAYVFTSGSTGTPRPAPQDLGPAQCRACARKPLRLGLPGRRCAIVATVPPQHMYGFESSVLLALPAATPCAPSGRSTRPTSPRRSRACRGRGC